MTYDLHGQHVRTFGNHRLVRTLDTTQLSFLDAGHHFPTVYHLELGRLRIRVPWIVWGMFS